jgi:pSer/pThr/pTyr-binding forkhead associated (FHA) protein
VRKVQGSFPSMITIGRTKNNDVVLSDPRVSKFHAYFRLNAGAWELADAGSVNGTRIGDLVLPPKGQPQPVQFGDRLRFGDLMLTFLDANATWQALRSLR